MFADPIDLGRFGLGLALVAGMRALPRLKSGFWAPLMAPRLHCGLAGVIAGYTFLPALQPPSAALLLLVLVFCGGWLGLVAGCSFDLRSMGRQHLGGLALEGGQAGLAVVLISLAVFLVGQFPQAGTIYLSGAALEVVCGICLVGISSAGSEQQGKAERPPLAALCGALLAAVGISQLDATAFQIAPPFAEAGRGIAVDDVADKLFWSAALGGAIGLLGDLVLRDNLSGGRVFYLLAGALLLGSGMAAALGLEPLWVGLVAGAWLINSTLRRLDILRAVERSHGFVQTGLLFTCGWFLGAGLAAGPVSAGVFTWVVLLVVGLRLAARLSNRLLGRYLPAARLSRHLRPRTAHLLDLDDVGLALAGSLMRVLPPEAGTAVLGAVVAGQLGVRLIGWWGRYLGPARTAR